MVRRKAKVYSRFNVGVFLKEKRRLRDEAAKAHKVLVKQKAKLSNLIRKVSIHPHPHPLRVFTMSLALWLVDRFVLCMDRTFLLTLVDPSIRPSVLPSVSPFFY